MDLWTDKASKPSPVMLRYKDPIELISYQLVDPIIQFGWKDHIKFRYDERRNENGERVISDMMTTDCTKETEKWIREDLHPDGVLLPMILYTDGVAVGFGNNKKCQPVICSIGNYSDEMLRKDFTKICLGYIPYLDSKCIISITDHLIINVGMSATDAKAEISRFSIEIDNQFWSRIISCFAVNRTGKELYILGRGLTTVFPMLAIFVGKSYLLD